MKHSSQRKPTRLRCFLVGLMILGILLIAIGPVGYMMNEGFGGPPGLLATSLRWEAASYVLCSLGAVMATAAATGLVLVDRRRND